MPGRKESTKVQGKTHTFVDLTRKGPSKGELNSLKAAAGIDDLIDREGKTHAGKNLNDSVHDVEEEILKDPSLLRTPTGYQPDWWSVWK